MKIKFPYLIIVFLLLSCAESEKIRDAFFYYSDNNSARDDKYINGYKFSVFYVPDSLEDLTIKEKLHLCLRIQPDTLANYRNDIVTQRVSGVEELNRRIESLNFSIGKDFYLKINNKFVYPVFSHMENTYGVEKGRLVHFMFVDKLITHKSLEVESNSEIVIIWNDNTFSTGKNYFRIPLKNILAINER